MKVKLTRDARIWHKAGEIVEVSPAEYMHLTSTGSAIPVCQATRQTKKPTKAEKDKK